MPAKIEKQLVHLRNTRDLRAEMLLLAGQLAAEHSSRGQITIIEPVVREITVQEEWDRLLPAIVQEIQGRMSLAFAQGDELSLGKSANYHTESNLVELDRPNYRFEVLRLLVGANLEDDGPQPLKGLIEKIGASQTPIRDALADLKQAGIVSSFGKGIEVVAEEVSNELLSRIRALPQVLRFRFQRGAQIKPPATLLKRALPMLVSTSPVDWSSIALSGVPVAQQHVPRLDLMGMPRLDLVARVPREAKTFDTSLIRMMDDGLELEPNLLAPAPLAVTLVRAESPIVGPSVADFGDARCAFPMDVFLSLLDMGLREQAIQYAKAVRA